MDEEVSMNNEKKEKYAINNTIEQSIDSPDSKL